MFRKHFGLTSRLIWDYFYLTNTAPSSSADEAGFEFCRPRLLLQGPKPAPQLMITLCNKKLYKALVFIWQYYNSLLLCKSNALLSHYYVLYNSCSLPKLKN